MLKIALIGVNQSGKTSSKDFFTELLEERGKTDVVTLKFADSMHEFVENIGCTKKRGFLQEFADITKKYYGDRVFVDAFKASDALCSDPEEIECDALICDDVKYPMELQAVSNLGYFTVYVDADESNINKRALENNLEVKRDHSSESQVHSLRCLCDFYIKNDETLLELKAACERILNNIVNTDRTF